MLDAGVAGGVAAGVANGVPAGVVDAENEGLNSLALGLKENDFALGFRLNFDGGGFEGAPMSAALPGPAPESSQCGSRIITGEPSYQQLSPMFADES